MQAVILAGGKGTRLATRLGGRPKPLVDIAGSPLLERQLDSLTQHGVDDVVLLVQHAAEQIQAFCSAKRFQCRVRLIDDGAPLGTAGAVLSCLDRLAERFLIVYGDVLFDLDITHLLESHRTAGADITLVLHPNDHPADSDLVEVDDGGWIKAFHPYPHPPGAELRNLVNAAFYVADRRALTPWVGRFTRGDFAKDLFPAMLREGARLHGYRTYEFIKDMGTPARVDEGERAIRTGRLERSSRRHEQAAVFLDLDGALGELRGCTRRADDFAMLPGAARAVKALNEAELRLVSTMAGGDRDACEINRIHARVDSALGAEGAFLDAAYHCPHQLHAVSADESPGLNLDCDCRKPGAGMVERAIVEMNIDRHRSWLVGNSTADMAVANRAGLLAVQVRTGEGGRDGEWSAEPDFVVDDLAAAAELIATQHRALARLVSELCEAAQGGDLILVGGDPQPIRSRLVSTLRTELAQRGFLFERAGSDAQPLCEPPATPAGQPSGGGSGLDSSTRPKNGAALEPQVDGRAIVVAEDGQASPPLAGAGRRVLRVDVGKSAAAHAPVRTLPAVDGSGRP
jgi:histidinol-phosphate phosphatase family protein